MSSELEERQYQMCIDKYLQISTAVEHRKEIINFRLYYVI